MPVTVDLPLVPPTAMPMGAALNNKARSSARLMRFRPSAFAFTMSGTWSSIAAVATKIWSALVRPLPSCGKRAMPWLSRKLNLDPSRPWSSIRSEPATVAPCARTIIASGIMPLPPMPEKK